MSEQREVKGRGGWRPNSGRKPMPKEQLRKRISVGFTPEALEWLRGEARLTGKPISRILGQLIDDEQLRRMAESAEVEDMIVALSATEIGDPMSSDLDAILISD